MYIRKYLYFYLCQNFVKFNSEFVNYLQFLFTSIQGSKGKKSINQSISPIIIHRVIHSADYILLKHLETSLHKLSNKNSIRVPTFVNPMNDKRFNKTLGTCVINSPMSPPSLAYVSYEVFLQMLGNLSDIKSKKG